MGNGSGKNANEPIPPPGWRHQRQVELPLSIAAQGFMVSLHGSMCARALVFASVGLCQWVCEKEVNGWGGLGGRGTHNMMFTLGLLFWDRATIQPRTDTHHMSNLVPFIITLYPQRPHLACYYQRSLLFPSMCV